MRNIIVLALLAVTVNCHAMDVHNFSVWDALMSVQKQRTEMLEKQLEAQMRAAGMNPPR
ncbi:MAG: hypothetical protein GAK35_00452 [Herbaspirillum frisingense]|uniref:Uncharacterized protein n=1 Tax=Herbaspirillum frisingense TaxID=92645 RepID=A0A7V8FZZ4_9BURK|nr:MAG: hypothetical protein GAK35_00452 [Herbaspirillum frisingense]